MVLVSDLYRFLKNPKQLKPSEETNFFSVLKEFFIYDFVITFCWAFLIGICTLLFDDFASVFKSKKTINDTAINIFLVVAIIAPILEEFAYRFSLRINRLTISVGLAVQLIMYLHLLKFIHVSFNYRIILMFITAIVFYFSIGEKLSVYLRQKINLYVYFNLLLFTLLHALNFSYFEIYHYLYIPLLISLQFFFGLYLSYVRIKHNFLYVVIFHIIHNAFIIGVGLLIKL